MDGLPQARYEFVSHNYAPFNAAVAKYIEKLEQPDPRVASQAFREKARGASQVLTSMGLAALLALIGVSLVVLCQQRSGTAPAESTETVRPKPPISLTAPPSTDAAGKVVTNYTLFTTVRVAEGIDVITGWEFAKSTDDRPERQFCYLRTPEEFGSRITGIAQRSKSGILTSQSSPSAFNDIVRDVAYETALTNCQWFSSK